MSRVVNDLFEVVELAHHGPEDLFISLVTLVGAFIILLTIQWKLALVVFAPGAADRVVHRLAATENVGRVPAGQGADGGDQRGH